MEVLVTENRGDQEVLETMEEYKGRKIVALDQEGKQRGRGLRGKWERWGGAVAAEGEGRGQGGEGGSRTCWNAERGGGEVEARETVLEGKKGNVGGMKSMVSRRWPTRELKEMKEESTSGGGGFGGGGAEGNVGRKEGGISRYGGEKVLKN